MAYYLQKGTKTFKTSFNKAHCYIDRIGAPANEQEKYDDYYILS